MKLDCFSGRPIGTLVDTMRGNPNARATGNGARRCAGKSRRHSAQEFPFPWDLNPHLIHSFWVDRSSHNPNGISIGSAGVAVVTILTDRQTDRPPYSVCGNRPHLAIAAIWPNNCDKHDSDHLRGHCIQRRALTYLEATPIRRPFCFLQRRLPASR